MQCLFQQLYLLLEVPLEEAVGGEVLYQKMKGFLKKWLDRLADALKRFKRKAVEALPAIVGSAVGPILCFLGKAAAFVAEHIWTLIVFVVELIGVWLMQRVKKG